MYTSKWMKWKEHGEEVEAEEESETDLYEAAIAQMIPDENDVSEQSSTLRTCKIACVSRRPSFQMLYLFSFDRTQKSTKFEIGQAKCATHTMHT